MAWLELTLDCDRQNAERLSDCLERAGAVSVSFSDAGNEIVIDPNDGEAPLWTVTRVTGLFDGGADLGPIRRRLEGAGFGAPRVARVEERAWERDWEQHVRPRRFGRRLWVLPLSAGDAGRAGVCVRLDPGLAFGTGAHATTALCLEWLDGEVLKGREVIDYGCGSGILGIAAAKLGARAVRCVDNDPKALRAAQDNARRNAVAGRLAFFQPEELPRERADLLLANLYAVPLIGLAERLTALLRAGGGIALSGLLSDQVEAVSRAYAGRIAFGRPRERDGWACLCGTRTHPTG